MPIVESRCCYLPFSPDLQGEGGRSRRSGRWGHRECEPRPESHPLSADFQTPKTGSFRQTDYVDCAEFTFYQGADSPLEPPRISKCSSETASFVVLSQRINQGDSAGRDALQQILSAGQDLLYGRPCQYDCECRRSQPRSARESRRQSGGRTVISLGITRHAVTVSRNGPVSGESGNCYQRRNRNSFEFRIAHATSCRAWRRSGLD